MLHAQPPRPGTLIQKHPIPSLVLPPSLDRAAAGDNAKKSRGHVSGPGKHACWRPGVVGVLCNVRYMPCLPSPKHASRGFPVCPTRVAGPAHETMDHRAVWCTSSDLLLLLAPPRTLPYHLYILRRRLDLHLRRWLSASPRPHTHYSPSSSSLVYPHQPPIPTDVSRIRPRPASAFGP